MLCRSQPHSSFHSLPCSFTEAKPAYVILEFYFLIDLYCIAASFIRTAAKAQSLHIFAFKMILKLES